MKLPFRSSHTKHFAHHRFLDGHAYPRTKTRLALGVNRNGARVTLIEKEERCGGHTLTDHTSPYPVDLGFQVRREDV